MNLPTRCKPSCISEWLNYSENNNNRNFSKYFETALSSTPPPLPTSRKPFS